MPTLRRLARFHGIEDREAFCWKCGDIPGSGDWDRDSMLHMAHVIDRIFDGLDNEANLRPLCITCHRSQPIFKSGEEAKALTWFDDRRDPSFDFVLDYIDSHPKEFRVAADAYAARYGR